jgi:hypothetical protein
MPSETKAQDWTERFQTHSRARHLTLDDVARMSMCRERDGWYVAHCDGGWILGRRSDRRHYPIVVGCTAIAFDSMTTALRYLRALLSPTMAASRAEFRELRIEVAHASVA